MKSQETIHEKTIREYLRTKDTKLFETIYRTYLKDVYRFVYSRVGNKEASEDITAEVFLTLIDVIGKYSFKSKFTTYLFGIAINKMRQYYYQTKRRKTVELIDDSLIEEIEQVTLVSDSVLYENLEEDEKRDRELSGYIGEILFSLSEKYRTVLENRFLKGYSIKVTARNLGMSEGNVRVIQNRAIKKAQELANNK